MTALRHEFDDSAPDVPEAPDAVNAPSPSPSDDRFDLSALTARLLCEQQLVTARWATWAEEVVSGWNSPSGAGEES